MKNKIVHIIGAGPIGLVTAWRLLQKKNTTVHIYEKNSIVGGMCRTWKWKNFLLARCTIPQKEIMWKE